MAMIGFSAMWEFRIQNTLRLKWLELGISLVYRNGTSIRALHAKEADFGLNKSSF